MRRNPITEHQRHLGLDNQEYAESLGYRSIKMFLRERREMNNSIVARIMVRYGVDLAGAIRCTFAGRFIAHQRP